MVCASPRPPSPPPRRHGRCSENVSACISGNRGHRHHRHRQTYRLNGLNAFILAPGRQPSLERTHSPSRHVRQEAGRARALPARLVRCLRRGFQGISGTPPLPPPLPPPPRGASALRARPTRERRLSPSRRRLACQERTHSIARTRMGYFRFLCSSTACTA